MTADPTSRLEKIASWMTVSYFNHSKWINAFSITHDGKLVDKCKFDISMSILSKLNKFCR